MKKLVFGISAGLSFVIFLLLFGINMILGGKLPDQNMTKRWSPEGGSAHASCFFSVNASISQDTIEEAEHSIDGVLADAGVTKTAENPSARLWVDAYSADGKISLSSTKTTIEADAIGIGGDFFLFHPMKLLSGAYFSGNDLMKDYCLVDQDVAWQLFGSFDIAGMTLDIGGIPHIITGVVKREEGRLQKAAGLDSGMVYVNFETLQELGNCNGINHYEIAMSEPVEGFTYNFVKDKFGYDEKETELVDNTNRYSLVSRLKLIPQFGARSMNGKAIIYPFWENIARAYEDICALITFLEMIFLAYTVITLLVLFRLWWKHKGWTIHDKWLIVTDKLERLAEGLRAGRMDAKARRQNK